MKSPSVSRSTAKLAWNGTSPGAPDFAPSPALNRAPAPASCAARSDCWVVHQRDDGVLRVCFDQRGEHADGI